MISLVSGFVKADPNPLLLYVAMEISDDSMYKGAAE
jgi:hypothetical protein